MAKLTIEVPDGLVNQVTAAGYSLEAVLLEALIQYLANVLPPQTLTHTRTWQLCGQFTLAELNPDPLSARSGNWSFQARDHRINPNDYGLQVPSTR